jgi:regulation of enolase protein 1 (concanavalin A-like superfamily)
MKPIMLFTVLMIFFVQPLSAQITDEFEDATLQQAWTWMREDAAYWRLEGGALIIHTQPGALNGMEFNNVRNMLLQPVTEVDDVTFETQVTFAPGYEYRNAGILYRIDDDNYIRVSRGIHEGKDDIWFEWELDGTPQFVYAESPAPMTCQLQLSILPGGAFRASWSIDGKVWQHFAERSITFPPRPASVGLQASNGDGMAAARIPVPAIFQYFRVYIPVSVHAVAAVGAIHVGSAYPAPLRVGEAVTIPVHAGEGAMLRWRVTDLLGREIRNSGGERMLSRGSHRVLLRPALPASGVYLLHIEAGGRRNTQRLVVTGR